MTDRYPGAFMVSLTLHGAIVVLMLLFAYAAKLAQPETTRFVELVSGDGDDPFATKAPLAGEPTGLKVETPKPPAPQPEEVKPQEVVPAVQTPPVPIVPTEKPLPKPPDLSKQIQRKIERAETKTKVALAKERAAEEKKLTKTEFDKANKTKATPTPAGPTKVTKIDSDGFKNGLINGSRESKAGSGGTAATRDPNASVMEVYFAMLQQRLRAALEKPPGLSDTLVTVVEVRSNADGSLTGARITKSSGSAEFDAAAMAAVATVRMPARPDNKSEVLNIPFRMKEQDQG